MAKEIRHLVLDRKDASRGGATTAPDMRAAIIQLRNAAKDVFDKQGTIVTKRGVCGGRSPAAQIGDIEAVFRTPFQPRPKTLDYTGVKRLRAQARRRGQLLAYTLPYGLEVFVKGTRRLFVEWTARDARLHVLSFARGRWERALLKAAASIADK